MEAKVNWTEELLQDLHRARAIDARPYKAIATALSQKHNVSLSDEACRKKFRSTDWSKYGQVDESSELHDEQIEKDKQAVENKKETSQTRTSVLCDVLEKAIEALPEVKKSLWKPVKRPKEDRSEDVGIILSDLHVGHMHTLEDTGGLSEYNLGIFKSRMASLKKALDNILELHSSLYKLPTLRIFSLGDIVAGMNDVGSWSPLYINSPIVDQSVQGFEALADFVYYYLTRFDNIEFYGLSGNHGRCKSLSTKILTQNGYKAYNEVKVGDLVGTVNTTTKKFEFNPIKEVHIFEDEKTIVQAKNRSFCLEATLDHDNLIETDNLNLKKIKSKDLIVPTETIIDIPISFETNNSEYDIQDDYLTLLGWIITDGSYDKTTSAISIWQSKLDNVATIRQLLNKLDISFTERSRSRNIDNICGVAVKTTKKEYCFRLNATKFTDKLRELLPQKESIPSWMYQLSDRQVKVLLDAIVAGDGVIRKSTMSKDGYIRRGGIDVIWGKKHFLEQLMGLLISHGIPCRVNKHKRKSIRILKDGSVQTDNYYLQIKKSRKYRLRKSDFKEVKYGKGVWCVTVENGTIAVMNEQGNAYFTGNCARDGIQKEHDNWDYVCHKFLETSFKNNPRIKFHIPKSWWYMDRIRGHNFLMVHGHNLRSGSGMPIKRLADFSDKMAIITKQFPDYTLAGHFHNVAELGTSSGKVIINGSFVGPDVYSLKTVHASGKPEQKIFGIGDRHGITWSYDIDLSVER